MKHIRRLALAAVFLSLFPLGSSAEMSWQFDILPGSLLANIKNDTFTLSSGPKNSLLKESTALWSTMPNASIGVAFVGNSGYVDLKVGPGILLNSRVRSLMLFGTLGASMELKPNIFMGPHIQIDHCVNPDWWGEGQVELTPNPNIGFAGGMHVTVGDKVCYLFSLDYYNIAFDAKGLNGWTPSQKTLDMSGLAIQFGIRATF